MRKRRVLALWLALSLVVSGNGMTVLAAEQGADMPVLESQEVLAETAAEENISGSTGYESAVEDKSEGTEPAAEGEASTEADKTEEGEDPETSDEEDAGQSGGQPSTEENGDGEPEETPGTEGQEPVIDGQEPAVSENDVEETEAPETETPKESTSQVQPYVSRMVTFTDDTGMRVTYDANASQQYSYVVENGVLTGVNQTVSENTVEPVKFEGNVELRQPEEGEHYTSVAAGVFGGNAKITYVKLPAGLTSVVAESFKGCTGLKGVYLPSTVTEIGAGAFEGCTAMTQISVPKAVTSIGDSAFKGDAKLHLVYIKDRDYCELTSIGASAFEGCAALAEFCADTAFVLPMKLESIGESAFKGCKAISKVDFTDTRLSALGAHAFEGCTGLTDLSPGTTLALIPEYAFSGCTALVAINFVEGKYMTIGGYAFSGCIGLKQLMLPSSVIAVRNYAFQNCTRLTRVEIICYNIEIGDRNENGEIVEVEAFPGNASSLVIVAKTGSNGYKYAIRKGLLPDEEAFYQYTVEDIDGVAMPNTGFTGGTILVTTDPEARNDVNSQNGKKGVKAGEKCWVWPMQKTDDQRNNYTFIDESLRCNGIPIEKDKENQKYFFLMPEGGAVITAEFRAKTPDKIKGRKVTVEFSAGEPLQNGKQDEQGYLGVELKEGQTTRMFLLDEDGESIPAAKLKFSSSDKEVATVNSYGIITAAGTKSAEEANATIQAVVKGGDGNNITINRTVVVKTSEAKSITLKVSDPGEMMEGPIGDRYGIQTAVFAKTIVASRDYKFELKANVYDGEDGVGKKLSWTTSDARVASIASATTEAKNPVNVVTVKKGCEGEATITVTANNASGAEKDKVTQKFVVRVYQEGYRLASSTVTVNPNTTDGGTMELISAYGLGLKDATVALYQEDTTATTPFTTDYDVDASKENCKKFNIKPVAATLKDGTYKVRVAVNGDTNEKNFLPLTIKVKRTTPAPTIKFNTERVKFNLFYKDGRSTADAEPTVVTTEITKLGLAGIRDVRLEPLNKNNADDKLFTENFEIDTVRSDFGAGKVVIRRKEGNLKYTSKKKPAVTGNLVIYYDGYSDSAAKKMKVTMPTCTTAPSYALRETKATYRSNCPLQEETLVLYDKKSKTKEQVVLDGTYTVTEEQGEIRNASVSKTGDGAIAASFTPEKGKLKIVLRNSSWDLDKDNKERTLSYNFTVNISNATPTVKPDQNAVTLNLNYPEQAVSFRLVSNQKGVQIHDGQTFIPVVTGSNADQIRKLEVSYENGVGRVGIKNGEKINKGTYKFECNPQADWPRLKKATLTVKVVDSQPMVKLGKGSMQLNTEVYSRNSSANNGTEIGKPCQEVAERSFTVSGKPEGYNLKPVGTTIQDTEIKCTTGGKEGAESHFVFGVNESSSGDSSGGVLTVSLKDNTLPTGNYEFSMILRYAKEGRITVSAKAVKFAVKVYYNDEITLAVSAKGKINLVNRTGEPSDKNGIVYTPTLKNLQGKITDVKIYDAVGSSDGESQYFDIEIIDEGKNAGKFYVTPKKTVKTPATAGEPVEYEYQALDNNQSYPVYIWAQVEGYAGTQESKNGIYSKTMQIKTAQVLPKVTVDKKELDVYLSTKDYDASFVVTPKSGSAGEIEEILFEEKDEKSKESFTLQKELRKDGSIKVIVHLKEGFEYAKDSVNDVKMYVKYKGQGVNTPETATSFTMKIKVN